MTHAIELTAVITSALYGILRGARHEFDPVGICCLAFVVAFGGGTLRDVLLDRHPVFWIADGKLPWIVFLLALGGAAIPNFISKFEPYLWVPDAFGLGLFSVLGAMFSLEAETPKFVAVLLGVVTGAFGGVFADIICNRVPLMFSRSPLYATCSFLGAGCFVLLNVLGVPESFAVASGITATVSVRVAAVRWNLQLPTRLLHAEPDEG